MGGIPTAEFKCSSDLGGNSVRLSMSYGEDNFQITATAEEARKIANQIVLAADFAEKTGTTGYSTTTTGGE